MNELHHESQTTQRHEVRSALPPLGSGMVGNHHGVVLQTVESTDPGESYRFSGHRSYGDSSSDALGDSLRATHQQRALGPSGHSTGR